MNEEALELCDMFKPGKYEFKRIICREEAAKTEGSDLAHSPESADVGDAPPLPLEPEAVEPEAGTEAAATEESGPDKTKWFYAKDESGRVVYCHVDYRKDFVVCPPYLDGEINTRTIIAEKEENDRITKLRIAEEKQREKEAAEEEERLELQRKKKEKKRSSRLWGSKKKKTETKSEDDESKVTEEEKMGEEMKTDDSDQVG